MPWIRFVRAFDWKPIPQKTKAFHAGTVKNVTRACAAQAVEKGAAVRLRKPSKFMAPEPE